MTSVKAGLVALLLAGLGVRLALALAHGAYGGDPLFSYQYRATLIAAGQWDGLLLMWHPPGYPLLLAAVMTLSGKLLSSFAAGVLLSLASTAALVWLVDRLIRHRLERQEFRLVAAAIVLLNEGLIHWQSAPLSEPPYLVAIAGVLVLLDRATLTARAAAAAGLLAGCATLLRFDGATVAAALALLIWLRFGFRSALIFSAGFLAVTGWLLFNIDYLQHVYAAQRISMTVPGPLASRLPLGLYHALTAWLPTAMPLPYWCAAALGAWWLAGTREDRADGRRLNWLLASVLAAGVLTGAISVMHKRTAAFAVPIVALWCAAAADALASRLRRRHVVLAGFIAVIAVDGLRLAAAWPEARVPGPSQAQARLLRDAGAAPARVFAFGSEPEIYATLAWPVVTPFFAWKSEVSPLYESHRGDPAGFIRALASAGYEWLALASPDGSQPVARQPYGYYIADPLTSDLAALDARPADFGLEAAGRAAASAPAHEVRLYRIRR